MKAAEASAPASVVARVTRLIENRTELSRAAQLSANDVNGSSFALGEAGFTAKRGQDLRWRISEGEDPLQYS